jgi:hypothetical protein
MLDFVFAHLSVDVMSLSATGVTLGVIWQISATIYRICSRREAALLIDDLARCMVSKEGR